MGVIHDIKNMLNPISSYFPFWQKFIHDPLKEGKKLSKEDLKDFGDSIVSVNECVRRIDNVLMMIKQTGKADKTMKDERIDLLIHECTDRLTTNQKKEVNIEPNIIAKVSIGYLYRMMSNLITNAQQALLTKYGNEYKNIGFIKIELKYEDGKVHLVVGDNGCGMSENVRENVFKKWFTTKGTKGTGIGMSVVKETVDLIHAEITIDSVEGEYTNFEISFEGRKDENTIS